MNPGGDQPLDDVLYGPEIPVANEIPPSTYNPYDFIPGPETPIDGEEEQIGQAPGAVTSPTTAPPSPIDASPLPPGTIGPPAAPPPPETPPGPPPLDADLAGGPLAAPSPEPPPGPSLAPSGPPIAPEPLFQPGFTVPQSPIIQGPPLPTVSQIPSGTAGNVAASLVPLTDMRAHYEAQASNPDVLARGRAAEDFERRDPQGFAEYTATLEQTQRMRLARAQLEGEQTDLQKLKDNIADRQKADAITQAKSDQVVSDAVRIASTPIDRKRWFKNQNLFGVIDTVAVAVLGGLIQGANRSPTNQGMDWITRQVDADVDDQKADIENKRYGINVRQNAVAQEFARTGDMYRAQEAVRLASYQVVKDQILTQQQEFDSRGTSFVKMGQAAQQIDSLMAQSVEAHRKEFHTEALANIKEEREGALARSTIAKNLAESAKLYAEATAAKTKSKLDTELLSPPQIAERYPELPKAAIPNRSMTREELGKHVDIFNKSLETAKNTTANQMQQSGTQLIDIEGKPLTQDGTPNGAPVVISNHETATKLNDKVSGANKVLTSVGNVRRFLATDPSALSREEWADATTDLHSASLGMAQVVGGNVTAKEITAMEKYLGTTFEDYTNRVKDKGTGMAHLDAVVRAVKNSIKQDVRGDAKYTGPIDKLLIDTSQPPPAEETPEDRSYQILFQDQQWEERAPNYGKDETGNIPGQTLTQGRGGISIEQGAVLDRLKNDLYGPDRDTIDKWKEDLLRPSDDTLHIKAKQESTDAAKRIHDAVEKLTLAANPPTKDGPGNPVINVRQEAQQILQNWSQSQNAPVTTPEQVR